MGWHKGNIRVKRLNSFSAASICKQGHNSPICQKSGFWKLPILHTIRFYWHTPEKNSQSCIVQHIGGIWRAQSPEQGVASCESCNNVGLQLHAQFVIPHSVVHLQFICRDCPVTQPISKPRAKDKISFGKETLVPSKWVCLWGQEKCHDLDQNV